MKYEDLQQEAKQFLAHCGQFTIDEHDRFEENLNTSANEMLGFAVRVLSEQAKQIQALADSEEKK